MVTSKKPNNIKGCNIGNIGNIGNIKKDLWRFFYTHKKRPFATGVLWLNHHQEMGYHHQPPMGANTAQKWGSNAQSYTHYNGCFCH